MQRRERTGKIAKSARRALETTWRALPWPHAADTGPSQDGLAELLSAYGAPDRHYHSLAHIAELLSLSAAYAERLGRPDIVDLAIFFHDAVYDVMREDNETASAALARERLTALGLAAQDVDEVARFIKATKHGDDARPVAQGDLAWFLDFDLSILGSNRETYARYAKSIRREYAVYPDDVYARGRSAALQGFLSRPRIFTIAELRDRWEMAARDNLAWELSRYAPRG